MQNSLSCALRGLLVLAFAAPAALAAQGPKHTPDVPVLVASEFAGGGGEGTYELSVVEVRPEIANRGQVARAIEASFPPALLQAGISGMVSLGFWVQEDGRVARGTVRVIESTNPRFESAAVSVAQRMRFRPAEAKNRPVAAWVQVPLQFIPPDVPAAPADSAAPCGSAPACPLPDSTGAYEAETLDRRPLLANRDEIELELGKHYPAALREQGIGGEVTVRFRLGADGVPGSIHVVRTTNAVLDSAATAVVEKMRFTPAMLGRKTVPVWIDVPMRFHGHGAASGPGGASPR